MKFLNYSLLAIGALLLVLTGWNFLTQGWISIQDYYLLAGAVLAIGTRWLPATLKVNLVLIVALLAAVEMGARWYMNSASQPIDEQRVDNDPNKPFKTTDQLMGYQPAANNGTTHSKTADEEQIFKVHYATDQYHRRVTPQSESGCRDRHLLFFGGSNTFGFGIAEHQTMPAVTAELAPQYRIYNYGYQGYGPQHLLARLAETPIETEFEERPGQAVFLFIDDHIKRVANTLRSSWVHRSPYYQLSADGSVVHNGTFNTAHPLKYRLYHDLLLSSAALTLLGIDIPLRPSAEDVHLSAKIIETAAKTYRRKFPGSQFSVIMLPAGRTELGDQFEAELKQLGIKVLNYQDRAREEFLIHPKYEPHSSVVGNQATVGWMVKDLGLDTGCDTDGDTQ